MTDIKCIMARHLRREHGWGIRRIAKELGEPMLVIRMWIGE
jgi:hypothetical protein